MCMQSRQIDWQTYRQKHHKRQAEPAAGCRTVDPHPLYDRHLIKQTYHTMVAAVVKILHTLLRHIGHFTHILRRYSPPSANRLHSRGARRNAPEDVRRQLQDTGAFCVPYED